MKAALVSEKVVDAVKIIRLKIICTPDKNSTRLGMFAYLHTQPNYQSLGFTEITLMFERHSADGKLYSRTFIVFSDVAVEKVEWNGPDEEITFIAARKSGEFAISNVAGAP